MSFYTEYVNANCAPSDFDVPVAFCPECGTRRESDYSPAGEYYAPDGDGPFPIYTCNDCGGEIDWE